MHCPDRIRLTFRAVDIGPVSFRSCFAERIEPEYRRLKLGFCSHSQVDEFNRLFVDVNEIPFHSFCVQGFDRFCYERSNEPLLLYSTGWKLPDSPTVYTHRSGVCAT